MRLLSIPIAATLLAAVVMVSGPARADVTVTFWADAKRTVPSLKIFEKENTGHAWVTFDGTLADGTPVHEAWGFAGHMPHGGEAGPIYRWTDKLRASVYKIPGGLRTEPPPQQPGDGSELPAAVFVSKTVTDDVFRGMQQTIGAWRTEATTYNVLLQNCVRFVDQIAGDAGLTRPGAMATRPTEYMTNLAKLNPAYTRRTDARAGTNDQPSTEAILARQVEEENGIILREQAAITDTAVRLIISRNDNKTREERAAMAIRQRERDQALAATRAQVSSVNQRQHQFNRSVKAAAEATIPLPTPSVQQSTPINYYMTPTVPSGGQQYRLLQTPPGTGGQTVSGNVPVLGSASATATPDTATSAQPISDRDEASTQPVHLSLAGAAAPSLAPMLWLGMIKIDAPRVVQVRLTVDKPMDVQFFLVGEGSAKAIIDSSSNAGRNAPLPSNMLRLSKGGAATISLTITPRADQPAFERLIVASRGEVLYDVAVLFLPVDRDSVEVQTAFNNLMSGFGKYFSEPYTLCGGGAPYGFSFVSATVSLLSLNPTYPRDCASWATCDITKADGTDVCSVVTIQGHNETGFAAIKNRDFAVNATLRARYRLIQQAPEWISMTH